MADRDEVLAQAARAVELVETARRLERLHSGDELEYRYFRWAERELADSWSGTRAIDAIAEDNPSAVGIIEAIRRAEERSGEIPLSWCRGTSGRALESTFGPDHWEDVEWAAARRCHHDAARLAPPLPGDGRADDALLEVVARSWRASAHVTDDLLARVSDVRGRLEPLRREFGHRLDGIGRRADLTPLAAVVGDPEVVATLAEIAAADAASTPPPGVTFHAEFAEHEAVYAWFFDQARAALAAWGT